MASLAMLPPTSIDVFRVPSELEAGAPPEQRGLDRDEVRLMVSDGSDIEHHRFRDLVSVLRTGDLLVVNVSATLPAAVDLENGRVVHFSTEIPGGFHVVEVRRRAGAGTERLHDVDPGRLDLPGRGRVDLLAPYPAGSPSGRLWASVFRVSGSLQGYLARYGRPISYGHTLGAFPIDDYQTVFAAIPGSAEMPSAGRPFSHPMLAALIAKGVTIAPIVLHTGVSSLEAGELPYPEWYRVPETTAALVDHTRRRSGRVIAVGTTVVRALESTADRWGGSHPGEGWTDLFIDATHRMRVVDGLITGWHQPDSTHLELLTAVGGHELVAESYSQALQHEYLWHEFGDSHLILPG